MRCLCVMCAKCFDSQFGKSITCHNFWYCQICDEPRKASILCAEEVQDREAWCVDGDNGLARGYPNHLIGMFTMDL